MPHFLTVEQIMSVTSWRVQRAISVALTSLALLPSAARAQGTTGLPAAKDLIAKYVQAVGGETWKNHKSARMKATLEVPGAGTATLELVQIFPNAVKQTVSVQGLGEIKSGYDGTTAWSLNPMMGPQILDGAQAEALKSDANPENSLRISSNIESSETLEKATMNGAECYKVKHTWKSGRVTTDCFGVSDGLLVATMMKAPTQMGEIETTTYQTAYKDFGGLKRPTSIIQEAMGQRQTITVTSFEWDNVDPKELEPPAEIKALAKKP
jgi:hypothetical protein